MRARAYYAHTSIRDHWVLRRMSRYPDQVVSLKRDPQCLSPQSSPLELPGHHIYSQIFPYMSDPVPDISCMPNLLPDLQVDRSSVASTHCRYNNQPAIYFRVFGACYIQNFILTDNAQLHEVHNDQHFFAHQHCHLPWSACWFLHLHIGWDGIEFHSLTPATVRLTGRMTRHSTGQCYKFKILEPVFFIISRVSLQQDNAQSHLEHNLQGFFFIH
ncbi:hypothetical protein TNCV_2979041 [Trichonephila clavipes]|nr:hypothetical protein TNCV_2979041 [Trichonephila clavipes]